MSLFYLRKGLGKFKFLLFSIPFRLKFMIIFGQVRADYASLLRCSIGRNFRLRGRLYCSDSTITMGNSIAIARSSSIAASDNSVITIGDGVVLGERTVVSSKSGVISIGERTTFTRDCLVSGGVTIGADCLFSNNVTVLSGSHKIHGPGTIRGNDANYEKSENYRLYDDVVIEDDCWLGANVVVLPGVSISKGTVVGANAVVTKTFPEYSVLTGVPAKVTGSRDRGAKQSRVGRLSVADGEIEL